MLSEPMDVTNWHSEILLQNFDADPLVIFGESTEMFIGWLSVKEVKGSTENHLCFTGGERTVVKKS
jgi:hypothetical protein